jgi:hypothetical protein
MQTDYTEGQGSRSHFAYRRAGAWARRVLAARYLIVLAMLGILVLYLPLLRSGFYLDDLHYRVLYSNDAGVRFNQVRQAFQPGPLALYSFVGDATMQFARDKAGLPWWASDDIRVNFFRPVSSLTLALDFSLWPDTALFPHIHSLLWFFALLLLAHQVYRSISGNAVAAGISILLLAVDDAFIGPAGWISNRHALIAMVFGVLSLWLYHLGARKKRWPFFAGAVAAYGMSLLSSEMGIAALGYLAAYILVLDRDHWTDRLKRIAPFILITAIWRLTYAGLGFGAIHSLQYVDPLNDPSQFLGQLLSRYPTYLLSAIGPPVADTLLLASPQATAWIAAGSLIALALLALIVHPVLRAHRTSSFWAIGLLCAAVPLTTGVPGQRNLGLISFGMMALMGQLLFDVVGLRQPVPVHRVQQALLRLVIPLLLVANVVLPVQSIVSEPDRREALVDLSDKAANFGGDPALAEQHVYIINSPGTIFCVFGMHQRLLTGAPLPASMNYLASGNVPVSIVRIDARTIVVTPSGGYTPGPGPVIDERTGRVTHMSAVNIGRTLEQIIYNPQVPFRVGQVIALSEVTVNITEMTADGRIAQAAFVFDRPLDDSRYVWLLWNQNVRLYEKVEMPPVGETRVYSGDTPFHWLH